MAKRGARKRNDGRVWIALSAGSLLLILGMMVTLGVLICANSFLALWPPSLERVRLADGGVFLGIPVNRDVSPDGAARVQYKVGNREINSGSDFRWVEEKDIAARDYPADAVLVNRMENGDFYGFIGSAEARAALSANELRAELAKALDAYRRRWSEEAEPLRRRLAALGDEWQQTHFALLKAEYELARSGGGERATYWEDRLAGSRAGERAAKRESGELMERFNTVKESFRDDKADLVTAEGGAVVLPLASIVDVIRPNDMGLPGKAARFAVNAWNLLSQYPREANTEGGLFPALFGTVVLVFIMAVTAFPLGVAAGVYLREYARDGVLARAARVAVNNLAGVPSIVYGIFGLGFFIYGVGGGIDRLLYPERVAAGISTYGGGGVIWSSLTLGLLTLPVVIVATEEALATIPSEMRQGSLALGATRFQTLWRVALPMASPGILTGFILAMARAAGEVAPLMLTGAVKSAHSLPLDGEWPFVHLERKFMHLGFHIYDMGFQSPNVEASKPLVYLTALVLLILVFVLNVSAFALRRRMREKYAMKGF